MHIFPEEKDRRKIKNIFFNVCFMWVVLRGCPGMTKERELMATTEKTSNRKSSKKVGEREQETLLKWCDWPVTTLVCKFICQCVLDEMQISDYIQECMAKAQDSSDIKDAGWWKIGLVRPFCIGYSVINQSLAKSRIGTFCRHIWLTDIAKV